MRRLWTGAGTGVISNVKNFKEGALASGDMIIDLAKEKMEKALDAFLDRIFALAEINM